MSHTTKLPNGYIALHDGDLWDCQEILLCKKNEADIVLPYNVVFSLVVEHIRQVKISQLENASANEVFGLTEMKL